MQDSSTIPKLVSLLLIIYFYQFHTQFPRFTQKLLLEISAKSLKTICARVPS